MKDNSHLRNEERKQEWGGGLHSMLQPPLMCYFLKTTEV